MQPKQVCYLLGQRTGNRGDVIGALTEQQQLAAITPAGESLLHDPLDQHDGWLAQLLARDGDGYVCVASPVLGIDTNEQRPLALKILLDCSGSMGGAKIRLAKQAVDRAIAQAAS
jgi:hypothetical protein